MDTAPVEQKDSSGMQPAGATYELADAADTLPLPQASPPRNDSRYVVYHGPGTGKTATATLSVSPSLRASTRTKRLSDVANETDRVRDLLAELDEDETAELRPVLQFAANGDTVMLGCHDLVITGPNNFAVIEFKTFRSPVRVDPDAGERRRPAALIVDEQAGAHWRALPDYAPHPLRLQACCAAAAPSSTSVASVVGSPNPLAAVTPEDECACILLYICEMYQPRVGIRITTQNRRLVRDHREGLRGFLFNVLTLLRFMAVALLAALCHQAQAPTFLLVMLGAIRHYGRRGDGHAHALPAPALQPQSQGAVCLAA
jgi:hypothetical protein